MEDVTGARMWILRQQNVRVLGGAVNEVPNYVQRTADSFL